MVDYNLTNFFETSLEMLCIANADGYFVKLNPRWTEVLGHSVESLMARPYLDFVHPDDREATLTEAAKIAEGQRTICFENRYLTASGDFRWLTWNASLVDGLLYAAARDITEIKERERYFDEMQEAADIGYWHIDLETNTPKWSAKTYDIHAVPRDTPVDMENAINYYAPEARPIISERVQAGLEKGEPWDEELPFIDAKGKKLWVRAIGKPQSDQDNKVTEIYGVFQDITARKHVELRLQESYREVEKYKQALDAQAIVAITDARGKIAFVNDQFCEISGYSREELIGQDHRLINSGHHKKSFFKDLWGTITSGQTWRGVVKNRAKDGSIYWVDTAITPIKNDEGKIIEYLAIRTDITKRKLLEDEVNLQKERLVKSSRLAALGEMAGGIAHEINNPLAIIVAASAALRKLLLKEGVKNQKVDDTLIKLDQTVMRISKIVSGLKSFSRTDHDNKTETVNINQLVEDALSFCGEKFRANGVQLDVGEIKGVEIECNPTQISQVLLNLLNNAYHAVENEPVKRIGLAIRQNQDEVQVRVEDSGQGIPREIRERIFEPFFTTKDVGVGTGLGLGISLGIARTHEGSLTLDTEASQTTFVLTLPIKSAN